MDIFQVSKKGGRLVNEDAVMVIDDQKNVSILVADGLGGQGLGDVASNLAVQAAKDVNDMELDGKEQIALFFKTAQRYLQDEQKRRKMPTKIRTTAVYFVIRNGYMQWGHIGDSRLYLFRRNHFKTRTIDHSIPQMLVNMKEIRESEIRHHPERNKLLRVLGDKSVEPDYVLSEKVPLKKGQSVLICTDGFWEDIEDATIKKLLKQSHNAGEWIEQMELELLKNSNIHEMDNYSAVAVKI